MFGYYLDLAWRRLGRNRMLTTLMVWLFGQIAVSGPTHRAAPTLPAATRAA